MAGRLPADLEKRISRQQAGSALARVEKMRAQLRMPDNFDLTRAVATSECRCELPPGAFGSQGWHMKPIWKAHGSKLAWPQDYVGYEVCPQYSREKIREERNTLRREVVVEAGVPIPFRHMKISSFDPRRSKPIPEPLLDWTESPKGMVLIFGAPGTGKTHIAVALLASAMEMGCTGRFRECSGLALDLHQTVRQGVPIAQDQASRCEVLLLDEYLPEPKRPVMGQDLLDQLIAHRFRHGLGTLVTTNRTLDELEAHSDWIASRLMSGLIHQREGEDQRVTA